MTYFLFCKNQEGIEGSIYRIAETESDLNNLNIEKSNYKIIEDSESNFNLVKLGNKYIKNYNNDKITYLDQTISFGNKSELQIYVDNFKLQIKNFTNNNSNHPLSEHWNSYYNQLNNLNLDSITYPLNKSLEQYFSDLNQPFYNILQVP